MVIENWMMFSLKLIIIILIITLYSFSSLACQICKNKIRNSWEKRLSFQRPYVFEGKYDKPLADVMKSSIWWYKNNLSPILPSTCRFLPSCSSYGLEAIEKFGPWKGGILTAWRILRCNPTGGKGYDPPKWPPTNYFTGR